jgi:purine-nucleoside phosphorylase
MIKTIDDAVAFVRSKTSIQPQVGVILGSGLGNVVDALEIETSIPYSDIPGAKASTVVGHQGRMILARVNQTPVVVMQAGELMLISDHINFMGSNPLRGPNIDDLGVRFPDMSEAYPESLRDVAKEVARELGQLLQEGVYLALSGPTYETPAEIRAFRTLGADAVGMSTVPEVIAMSQMQIPVLGISCITNMAAGILKQKLTHQEVMDTTARVQADFTALVLGCLQRFAG